jgi:hypothetical protein
VKRAVLPLIAAILIAGSVTATFGYRGGEFLTESEIDAIRRNQKIDPRVKLYLRAALLRLTSARARMTGQETLPGDPLEYFTPEDMLDGYYKILNSVMFNIEDASRKIPPDRGGVRKALKHLESQMKKAVPELESMEKMAVDKNEPEMTRLIQRAIEISKGALEGAEQALADKFSE